MRIFPYFGWVSRRLPYARLTDESTSEQPARIAPTRAANDIISMSTEGLSLTTSFDLSGADLEALAVVSIESSRIPSVALENFERRSAAEALGFERQTVVLMFELLLMKIASTSRGLALLLMRIFILSFGMARFSWQAEFGKDPVIRDGEDNRMVHNFVFDHLRLLTMTNGLKVTTLVSCKFGFAMNSEDLAKDFEDSFDQLYGGVFSTEMTFFKTGCLQIVIADHTIPLLMGLELYFGPQEPVVKEVIDSVYSARSTVWVSSPFFGIPIY